jgi:FixJ family two-component response regulator
MINFTNANFRTESTVFLLDDDPSILNALGRGLRASGFSVRTWSCAHEFLDQHDASVPGCLVVDVSMPGLNGLDLQDALISDSSERYMVFISGTADIALSVRAMKAGAVSFLTKPVRLSELTAAVREAMEKDALARETRRTRASVEARLESLTLREREVLQYLLVGKLNKQIAASLGIAEKTIKVHRGRVMEKMRVHSVAELVTAVLLAGVAPHPDVTNTHPDVTNT